MAILALPANVRRNMGPILQRLPIMTHISMIPFVLLGPTYLPYLFGMVLVFVHCMLWTVNLRYVPSTDPISWRNLQY